MIYINRDGEQLLINQKEVLDFLSLNKEQERNIPDNVDKGKASAIAELTVLDKSDINELVCLANASDTKAEVVEKNEPPEFSFDEAGAVKEQLNAGQEN